VRSLRPLSPRSLFVALPAVALAAAIGAIAQTSCAPERAHLLAKRVDARHELIGGPRALGEVGDWLLESDTLRVIVQDEGFSRGFGVFGGSLIDADLVRADFGAGDSRGGRGRDNFGEMFPAFFVEAVEPTSVIDPNVSGLSRLPAIEVERDGSDGQEAVIVVRGYGNDFLAMTQYANEVLLDDSRQGPRLLFTTRYRLKPGVRYIEIETTVQNIALPAVTLDWGGGQRILGADMPTPLGDIVLFGAGNRVFFPHEAGYDLRYRLERVYKSNQYTLPAFPGLVGDFIATTGPEVSYGIVAAEPSDPARNYPYGTGQFADAQPHSVHVPFVASAFTGVFASVPPPLLPNDGQPGGEDEFTFKRYLIVGTGDVASIGQVAYELLDVPTGELTGRVLEDTTSTAVEGAWVIAIDDQGRKLTQCTTDANGRFRARLPPGDYRLVVNSEGRKITDPRPVTITRGASSFVDLIVPTHARLTVTIVEPGVGRVPAKITLVGNYDAAHAGDDPKSFLFDLSLGEGWRHTDLVPDDANDPQTRRYIETHDYTSDGATTLVARPGRYRVFVGRGLEYTRFEADVELVAGATATIEAPLRRVVDTTGYIGADFHLHSIYSLDSFAKLDDRVTAYAAEGMEYAVSSDHNFVTDYGPTIARKGMERWLGSAVGLELTTIDRGHYNGFPLRFEEGEPEPDGEGGYTNTIASRTFGSFNWAGVGMDEIFSSMRALGRRTAPGSEELQPVIVQVNHPRGGIGGYFDVYGLNSETLTPEGRGGLFAPRTDQHPEFAPEAFSWSFDAMEIINGKRNEWLHDFRVPPGVTVDPVSCCPVTPGEVFRELGSFECDAEVRDCTCTPADTQAQVDAGLCATGRVVYPGVVDDWLQMTRAGLRVTATANSDTHSDSSEAAWPRTYVRVPDDRPRLVTADDVVTGLTSGDVTLSLGPFVLARVGSVGLGGVADASAGRVTLDVEVRTAPWITVDRLLVHTGEGRAADVVIPADAGDVWTTQVELDVPRDGFVVVEVSGAQNLFPSLLPDEQPPVRFEDALNAIGGSIGLGSNPDALFPELIKPARPLAITNPIWLDADGDGQITPSIVLGPSTSGPADRGPPMRPPRVVDAQVERLATWLRPTDNVADVRRLLLHQARHDH
jgi:hypothetical protein